MGLLQACKALIAGAPVGKKRKKPNLTTAKRYIPHREKIARVRNEVENTQCRGMKMSNRAVA